MRPDYEAGLLLKYVNLAAAYNGSDFGKRGWGKEKLCFYFGVRR